MLKLSKISHTDTTHNRQRIFHSSRHSTVSTENRTQHVVVFKNRQFDRWKKTFAFHHISYSKYHCYLPPYGIHVVHSSIVNAEIVEYNNNRIHSHKSHTNKSIKEEAE